MGKTQYFLITLLFLLMSTRPVYAEVILTYPANNSTVSSDIVTFQWENTDTENEYEYMLYISNTPICSGCIGARWITDTQYTRRVIGLKDNWWYLQYCKKAEGQGTGECEYDMQTETFHFTIGEADMNSLTPEPASEPEELLEEVPVKTVLKIPEETKTPTVETNASVLGVNDGLSWNVDTISTNVIESLTNVTCRTDYISNLNKIENEDCEIPGLFVTQSKYLKYFEIQGNYAYKIEMIIDKYVCKRELFKPQTWFNCQKSFDSEETYTLYPNINFSVIVNNNPIGINYFSQENGSFLLTTEDTKNILSATLQYTLSFSLPKYNFNYSRSGDFNISITEDSSEKEKPFSFPFLKDIGVTQWHGNTSYEKPHTGIDFGSTQENIIAISNGTVIAKGWDDFNGECFSGGNYLVTKQFNGMYAAYFHLKKVDVDVGESIKKGQILGISGNTGSWNCQKLAYHLHFEIRKDRKQNTHVNPVEYINAEWSNILTLGATQNPGRFTGDNPHPGK